MTTKKPSPYDIGVATRSTCEELHQQLLGIASEARELQERFVDDPEAHSLRERARALELAAANAAETTNGVVHAAAALQTEALK